MGDDSDDSGGCVVGSLCVEVKLPTFVELRSIMLHIVLAPHVCPTYRMRKYPAILK